MRVALRGDKTVQEIAAKRQVHPTQMSTWKRQAIEGMTGVSSDKAKKAENKDGEIGGQHAKIGQLGVEDDFWHKGGPVSFGGKSKGEEEGWG